MLQRCVLSHLQELSQHSGVALHHIAQLYGHGLMYHATLLISKGGVPIMRLLSAGASLADLLSGERSSVFRRFSASCGHFKGELLHERQACFAVV
jgi:hypothetical protein